MKRRTVKVSGEHSNIVSICIIDFSVLPASQVWLVISNDTAMHAALSGYHGYHLVILPPGVLSV